MQAIDADAGEMGGVLSIVCCSMHLVRKVFAQLLQLVLSQTSAHLTGEHTDNVRVASRDEVVPCAKCL